jgi:osmotically-inducible protein OsmY
MLFRRRPRRPIDRFREAARTSGRSARRTALRSGQSARRTALRSGRKAWNRAQSTRKDIAKRMPAHRARVERRKRFLFLVGGSAAGAALMALFDPVRGKARRARLVSQAGGFARRRARRFGRLGRRVVSDIEGYRDRVTYGRKGDYIAPNDVTLEQKVESEAMGRSDVPRGIVVNVEDGLIVLRGQVESEDQIEHVERLVRRVDGVRDVENLLHVKGTMPPNKAAAWSTR